MPSCYLRGRAALRSPAPKHRQQSLGHPLGNFKNGDSAYVALVAITDLEEMPSLPLADQPDRYRRQNSQMTRDLLRVIE
jgi:hypothetical protein